MERSNPNIRLPSLIGEVPPHPPGLAREPRPSSSLGRIKSHQSTKVALLECQRIVTELQSKVAAMEKYCDEISAKNQQLQLALGRLVSVDIFQAKLC